MLFLSAPAAGGGASTIIMLVLMFALLYFLMIRPEKKKKKEAEQMAAWLINHGLDPSRIIVENKSMTTTQNAIRSYKILRSQYPEVDSVAIVSSDYHVAWGATMFQTQFTIAARELGDKMLKVVSNAAAYTGKEFKDVLHYQAGGILSIAGIDS